MAAGEHELHIALQEEAAAMSYRLYLVNLRDFPTYRELIHRVNPLLADGVAIGGSVEPDAAIKLSEIMPVVVHGERDVFGKVDRIRLDNALLGEELTNHVISHGHRRIAVVLHSVDTLMWGAALGGYRRALENAGIQFDARLIGEKWKRKYHEVLGEMLSCSPRPTALLGWTIADHLAILSVLAATGYRVPQDLSYVGWTTSRFTNTNAYPVITCSDDVQRSLSRATIQRLMDRIEDRSLPACDQVVEASIRRGETCVNSTEDAQFVASEH